jgi:hypothetical protein
MNPEYSGLLFNGQLASYHKGIEHFLPITCGLPNFKERHLMLNELFVGFGGLFGGGHRSLQAITRL